jgi:hypothetical protein
MNTAAIGEAFEKEIAELYELLGFDVQHNVPMDGQQIDLLATITIPGSGKFSQMIECKFKGNGQSVSNEDIQSIAPSYVISKALHNVSGCVVVTNSSFSIKAKEVARSIGITLKTQNEILKELINFTPYTKKLVSQFNETFGIRDTNCYIQTKAKANGGQITSLTNYIDEWLNAGGKKPIVIKGGYGTGKSSFCQFYSYKLITENEDVIPVVIQLRDFQKAFKIDSLIRDFLEEKCAAKVPKYLLFEEMFNKRKILLFFDGFDEMASNVDASILEANLYEIEKYAIKGNVILTCRPEYFITEEEERKAWSPINNPLSSRMALYEPIELEPWDIEQIKRYVRKRMKNESREKFEMCLRSIISLPELSDLSSRAVHLELIVKMLPTMLDKGISINRPNLYRTYIESELAREVIKNKRERIIADGKRFEIMQNISTSSGTFTIFIDFAKAREIIRSYFSNSETELDIITRDFLNRSFLIRSKDSYAFAHKSIAEYLYANQIAQDITTKGYSNFLPEGKVNAAIAGIAVELLGGVENITSIVDLLKIKDIQLGTPLDSETVTKMHFVVIGCFDFLRSVGSALNLYLAHDIAGMTRYFMNIDHNSKSITNSDPDPTIRIWRKFWRRVELFKNYQPNTLTGDIKYIQKPENVKILSEIRECLVQFQGLNVTVVGNDEVVRIDRDAICRIFENIISNAFNAIGTIGQLLITLRKKREDIFIDFSNDGPAIAQKDLAHIFDLYFSTREGHDFHGIGLYMVKLLAHEIGAKIQVHSDKNSTIFTIELRQ